MAACLKSSRPIEECRAEMFKGCRETMGQTGCPMVGGAATQPAPK